MSQLDLDTTVPFPPLAGLWYGVVTSPPSRSGGQMGVTIPDMNPDLEFKSRRWQTRDSQSLPLEGDDVLCGFDNRNDLWVINWWPSGPTPGITTSNYADGPPVGAADDHIWSAMNVNATAKRLMFQYDEPTDTWIKEDLVPLPVQNNQWLKGSGGAVVWTGIVEDTIWNNLTLVAPVINYGAAFGVCGYRKLGSGMVVLRGLAYTPSTAVGANFTFATLPAGYRPSYQLLTMGINSGGSTVSRIDVATSGALLLVLGIGAGGWFSLDNIRFFAEG